jgi:hypothetical protein
MYSFRKKLADGVEEIRGDCIAGDINTGQKSGKVRKYVHIRISGLGNSFTGIRLLPRFVIHEGVIKGLNVEKSVILVFLDNTPTFTLATSPQELVVRGERIVDCVATANGGLVNVNPSENSMNGQKVQQQCRLSDGNLVVTEQELVQYSVNPEGVNGGEHSIIGVAFVLGNHRAIKTENPDDPSEYYKACTNDKPQENTEVVKIQP